MILLSFTNVKNDEFFNKSPKKYKIKNYLYADDLHWNLIKIDFEIVFNDHYLIHNGKKLYSISFGNKQALDYLSYSDDTIYYFPDYKKNSFTQSPLFILNNQAINDTIYVKTFGVLQNQNIVLSKKYYYSSIKDTVYCFKVFDKPRVIKQYPYVTSSYDPYNFSEIIISRKYGFISLKYSRFECFFEIRYR